MERLPLFPLNTVLFPRMLMALRIFEERYKLMIGRCIDAKAPIGVVLIREGVEAGGPAEPFDVGTTARIARVQRLADGRMNLVTYGERRFRIERLDRGEPYLEGDVEWVESTGAAEAEDDAHKAATLFGELVRLSYALKGEWARRIDLPGDPDELADFIAPRLDVPPADKQRLLETLSVPDRLAQLNELLGDRIRALTERWEETRRERFAGAKLN